MTISISYLKLTISDIFSAATSVQDEAYFSLKNLNDEENRPIIFINARFSGLVIESNDDFFLVDDGTGVICVENTHEDDFSNPKIGDYVEVLGKIQGNIKRSIKLRCFTTKNDPMEEVKYLLEQAAIHRNNALWHNTMQERFLSSDTLVTTGFDRLSEQVTDLIMNNQNGVSYNEIKQICGNDEITKRIISVLENTGIIYSSKDLYYPL